METVKNMDPYFENYMGLLFSNIIKQSKNTEIKTAVEFAPGFRIKGAYSLRKIGFKGTLYVLDTNDNVLEYIKEIYQIVLPEANIICLKNSLKDSLKYLPQEIDLFLANHPLDDMIIYEYLGNKSVSAFNNTVDSKTHLYNAWGKILENQEIDKITNIVFNEWKYFLHNIKIKLFILSQYKSAYFKGKENISDTLTKELFEKLKIYLNSDDCLIDKAFDFEFADFDEAKEEGFHLKDNIQNSKNWIVMENEI
jgi:hypothetical protein